VTVTDFPQIFPYFGGKGRVAAEVWRRFGPCDGVLDPFAGSLAVHLRNPYGGRERQEVIWFSPSCGGAQLGLLEGR